MDDTAKVVSFQVMPGPKGIAEAEQCLRSAGFAQIKRSHTGRRMLQVTLRDYALQKGLIKARRYGSRPCL